MCLCVNVVKPFELLLSALVFLGGKEIEALEVGMYGTVLPLLDPYEHHGLKQDYKVICPGILYTASFREFLMKTS